MGLLYYISYVAVLAAFAFVTLSLASGLLYVSELIEENSRLAKKFGQRGLYVVIFLHVLLYFFDSLPLAQTVFSIFCHLVYLQNFTNSWPFISLTSPSFLASCALVLFDHFTWFFFFARITHQSRHSRSFHESFSDAPGFAEIASFFAICVWLVPLFLFLSLSANDNALPVSAAEPGTSTGSGFSQATQARVSLIRSIFALFSFDMVPRVRPRGHRRDTSEGLIAPRTPMVPQSPVLGPPNPIMGSSPRVGPPQSPATPRYRTMTPPPRTPGPSMGTDEPDAIGAIGNFTLGAVPNRRPSTSIRRQTGDAAGAGRRSSLMRSMASDNLDE